MTGAANISILPYSKIVGQCELRRALEIGFIGGLGVLATGQRGTAKSTTIRAFSRMVYDGRLPVTMPLGVTDDRVLGGYDVDALLGDRPQAKWREGLIAQAGTSGMLYVDEINLLEDHIVNLVLDAAATGILTVQRENADRAAESRAFALVGSMNPDEGPLRPQLLDRFGMVVRVHDENSREKRREILSTLLDFDLYRDDPESTFMTEARKKNDELARRLHEARSLYPTVTATDDLKDLCAAIASEFHLVGHRGDLVMLQAARARAAFDATAVAGRRTTVEATRHHLTKGVAKPAIIHRRPNVDSGTLRDWTEDDDGRLRELLGTSTG